MSSQRVNLWSSPNFKNTDFWGSDSRQIDDNGWLTITPAAPDKNQVGTAIDNLEPSKEYVLSVEINTHTNTTGESLRVQSTGGKWLASTDTVNGRAECRLTAPGDGEIYVFMFGGADGAERKFRSPMLELASTYDAAVRGGGASPTRWCSQGTLTKNNHHSMWVVAA